MSISKENHLSLLKEILSNHHQDRYGATSEYEQAARIVNNLLADHQFDQDTDAILNEIHGYCQGGAALTDHESYIDDHHVALSQWVNHLGQYK